MISLIAACSAEDSIGRRFHASASAPPGRSTRSISASAAGPSNQWKAWPTVTASALSSGSGIASAVPSSARAAGPMAARISATGSTAITSQPSAASGRVSLPLPAARSTTVRPGAQIELAAPATRPPRAGSRGARARRPPPTARSRSPREGWTIRTGPSGGRRRPRRRSRAPAPRPAPRARARRRRLRRLLAAGLRRRRHRQQLGDAREVGAQHLDVGGRVERRRGMEDRVQPHRARADDAHLLASVQARDPGRVGAQELGREVSQRADDARLDELDLAQEVVLAVLDLLGVRIAVAGRAALQHVGDEDVGAGQPDLPQQPVEQLARPARRTAGPARPRSCPGASPTNIRSASALPEPKTTVVRVATSCGQRVQSRAWR